MQTLENIKKDLRQKAESKFATLGREQELFINWMAQALYGLHKELRNSQDYIVQNVARRLTPEHSPRPVPVHALAHAVPKKEGQVLRPSDAVFTMQRFGERQPQEIYFTPIRPVQLTGANVRWRCHGNLLEVVSDGLSSDFAARTAVGRSLRPGVLWLGIEPVKGASLPKHLIFHFDFGLENDGELLAKLLPLVQWHHAGQNLPTEMGMGRLFREEEDGGQKPLDAECLHLCALEKKVIEAYNRQFVCIENKAGFSPSEMPIEVRECFSEETIEAVKKQSCIWLKLVFPNGFGPTAISQTQVRLNCFPILNRKMDKTRDFNPSHFGSVEIRPLSNADNRRGDLGSTGDFFLGMERIFSNKTDYRATTFESFREVLPGYYALQQGRVEANDFRDVLHRADELAGLIQSHSSRLLQVAGHSTQQALNDLLNGCRELQDALHQTPPQSTDPGYYLHMKATDPQDMIYVRFWLTQGKAAENVLERGDFLEGGDGAWVV